MCSATSATQRASGSPAKHAPCFTHCCVYLFFIVTGDDFITTTFSETVSAGSRTLELRPIPIRDDDVNENEQMFVLVARILGQAADSACFQIFIGDPCSPIGGTVLRIRDDDCKYIVIIIDIQM